MAGASVLNQVEDCMDLPPGFRFCPTDKEIITDYLSPKVVYRDFSARAVGEVDLNKCEPWELPGKAKMGEKEWYFFYHKDRKYPAGTRTNRATKRGYWKATGKDTDIYTGKGTLVGMKKILVFYEGRAPKGTKTNWVMHEFRLHGESNLSNIPKAVKDEWVVCRVFQKSKNLKKTPQQAGMERVDDLEEHEYFFDEPGSLPPLMDPSSAGPSLRPETSLAASAGYLDNDFEFTTNPASFSNLLGTPNQQPLISNPVKGANDGVLNYPQLQPQSSYYAFQGTANLGYLHQDHDILRALTGDAGNNDDSSAIRKHCKIEQYSNQSFGCPSQDTGLSTDHNTEIYSEFSKPYFDDLDYGSIIWEC